jgi:ACS family tartrate transporter-like MFS transporter
MDNELNSAVRKAVWRLTPLLFMGAILAHLDRINVGIAALQMNKDVGLSPAIYGFGVGAFFIAYAFFEVPSNMGLARFGARLWIARIMLTWGLVSASSALIVGDVSFVANRILLGAAEAGFLPGAFVFLSSWLPAERRARVFSYFMVAIPIAAAIGSPLSALLMQLDGLAGLRGWQWLFIVEGLPPVILALVILLRLRDRPADAEWLSDGERKALIAAIGEPAMAHTKMSFGHLVRTAKTPGVWLLTGVLSCLGGIAYGVTFWLPQVIKSYGLNTLDTGLLSALPYACGAVAMLVWSRHSDKTGERRWHLAAPALLAALMLVSSIFAGSLPVRLTLLTLAMTCIYSLQPVFWSLVSVALRGPDRVIGLALISAGGTFVAFLVPMLVGFLRQLTGGFDGAFVVLAAFGVVGAILAIFAGRIATD